MPQTLSRFRLATLPTPLVPAHRLHDAIGGPLVWIKRDDLTGFATAGNKARALEFLVGDAVDQGCTSLVTGGGAGSNFCAASAAAARVAGLECHLVLYGSPPAVGQCPHPNLAAALEMGAQVHFTGRPNRSELDRAVPALAAALAEAGDRPYAMPRGGATAVGAAGYAHAFDEMAGQLDAQGVAPGVIVVAAGSGGTQAGLVAGSARLERPLRVLGATVSRPPDEMRVTVATIARACGALLSTPEPLARPDQIEVVDALGPGFGVASVEGEQARRIGLRTEGLLLDPVYSAKAFAVVLRLIADGFGRPIVFWHTGGLPATLHHLSQERSLERSVLCPT